MGAGSIATGPARFGGRAGATRATGEDAHISGVAAASHDDVIAVVARANAAWIAG